ncbi:unnamed protein product [Cyprideis torosa]|uniref:Uncharacterized protein n=1 Tax=Cyprideis torosa TaxID=163714 RepID=A0A7R8WM36_9CRUS|nr:unnamed protein product [Cyprideis torosa]CAG0898818.1 unnamed protein product [Cyprideis torosa]
MGESADIASGSSSLRSAMEEEEEPKSKKVKVDSAPAFGVYHTRLENRLGEILRCTVCLDLPKTSVYQCTNGHLMCAACFTHILADGRLRDSTPACPSCRVEISKSTSTRNLAVEKAVSELPTTCDFCSESFPRSQLVSHQSDACPKRTVKCSYVLIGCKWTGPACTQNSHESECEFPNMTGKTVLDNVTAKQEEVNVEKRRTRDVMALFSLDKFTFSDIQFKPYRTDDFVPRLFYETSRFSAFNQQWVLRLKVLPDNIEPWQSNQRSMAYQLVLKTRPSSSMRISFFLQPGPFSELKELQPHPRWYEFTTEDEPGAWETEFEALPLESTHECNRLLSAKLISLRVFLFHHGK